MEVGHDFLSKTLPRSKFELCLQNGDSKVMGRRGGRLSFLPQALGTGWDLTFPTTWLLAAARTLSSAAWAGARAFQGARTFADAQGACARGCLLRRVRLGRLGAPGSLRGPPGRTGPCNPSPLLAPEPGVWRPRCPEVGESGHRGLSEGGWWMCAACNAASPAHSWGQGVQNAGLCIQWGPWRASHRKSRAVTVMGDVGPGVRIARVQVPPLPLPSCGISG